MLDLHEKYIPPPKKILNAAFLKRNYNQNIFLKIKMNALPRLVQAYDIANLSV